MEGGSSKLLGTLPIIRRYKGGACWEAQTPPFTLLSLVLTSFQRFISLMVGDKRNVQFQIKSFLST
ncbi:hypothetical protein XBKB1_2460002 [Xenorhabdus bovienii str. kraussei Becker Underwood]|uniref:Uncharacterized protein n=1 Tax=Xenorhabdus bovienii str. kraussei Becker Underwood TaxID=1398204 RepID=A0A077PWE6_XENBV|nr:hypothetical protein XBKB1_2460002 [Xenorhabdus bovienii str. kraussei Becker Underwood]